MFLPSHPVYMEECLEPWIGTTLPLGRGCEALLNDVGRPRFFTRKGYSCGNVYIREIITDLILTITYRQIQPPQRADRTIPLFCIRRKPLMFTQSMECTSPLKPIPENKT